MIWSLDILTRKSGSENKPHPNHMFHHELTAKFDFNATNWSQLNQLFQIHNDLKHSDPKKIRWKNFR